MLGAAGVDPGVLDAIVTRKPPGWFAKLAGESRGEPGLDPAEAQVPGGAAVEGEALEAPTKKNPTPEREGKDKDQVKGFDRGADKNASRSESLDWAATQKGIAGAGAAKGPKLDALLAKHRAEHLAKVFAPGVELGDVVGAMRALREGGQTAAAEKIRVKLFQANQHALIDTLQVDKSERYAKQGPAAGAEETSKGKTFCNVYAHDLVQAMGGYIPRTWWRTRKVIDKLQAGAKAVTPAEYKAMKADAAKKSEKLDEEKLVVLEMEKTVHELSADALTRWFFDWGPNFGWEHTEDPEDAQSTANGGGIVVAVAMAARPKGGERGHISVIVAEGEGHQAMRDDDGKVKVPLTSQSGAQNFKYSDDKDGKKSKKSKTQWWKDAKHQKGGFWKYKGAASSPVFTPEQMGLAPQ